MATDEHDAPETGRLGRTSWHSTPWTGTHKGIEYRCTYDCDGETSKAELCLRLPTGEEIWLDVGPYFVGSFECEQAINNFLKGAAAASLLPSLK